MPSLVVPAPVVQAPSPVESHVVQALSPVESCMVSAPSIPPVELHIVPPSLPVESCVVPAPSPVESVPLLSSAESHTVPVSSPVEVLDSSNLPLPSLIVSAPSPVVPTPSPVVPAPSPVVPTPSPVVSVPSFDVPNSPLHSHQNVVPNSPVHPSTVLNSPLPSPPTLNSPTPPVQDTSLPQYIKCHDPTFAWGHRTGEQFCQSLMLLMMKSFTGDTICLKSQVVKTEEILLVSWPGRLLFAFQQDNPMEQIALKAAMVTPSLLLQKPSSKSRSKDHLKCLGERLVKWHEGAIEDLLDECRVIQGRLTVHNARKQSEKIASAFERLVSVGNIKAAIRLVTEQGRGAPLPLSHLQADGRSTKEHLLDKHPNPQPIAPEALFDGSVRSGANHPVAFATITAETIRKTIQRMSGLAGPSGLDTLQLEETHFFIWASFQ